MDVLGDDGAVRFGRAIGCDLGQSSAREWLVTNGLGSYASGTIDGSLTRRYHGILVAALAPPLGRTLLVAALDERAFYLERSFALSTERWHSGAIEPLGANNIERFELDGATPVWHFALGDALLEKRLTMEPGSDATVVRYRLLRASATLRLEIKVLTDYRDFHGTTRADPRLFQIEAIPGGVRIQPRSEGSAACCVRSDRGVVRPQGEWYYGFDLPAERERGLPDAEDHLHAATVEANLEPGESLHVTAAVEGAADGVPASAFARRAAYERALLETWRRAQPKVAEVAPAAVRRLVLAADQFIVKRATARVVDGASIVAGYHWFADWGRDAMIALPGLALVTGRLDTARAVLRTFAAFEDGGLLPNDFSDRGSPGYNGVDTSLWFVEAVRSYVEVGGPEVLEELFDVLVTIVEKYSEGTRFGIRVDPADGLVTAGAAGVQLTWMDAKVGDRVVTPRAGKAVEINALWYNALCALAQLAPHVGRDPEPYARRAERVRASFERFAGGEEGGLLDVIDGPEGVDASLRPNQLFAVALPFSPLDASQQRAVVEVCARHLLTSHGMRSLSPGDPRFVGRYGGPQAARDAAYHQGTVWGWLLGPFALAYARAYDDRPAARALLEPLLEHLSESGLGTLGEIFDGDAPFASRGCIAQAWTVGEVLRAWHALAEPAPALSPRSMP